MYWLMDMLELTGTITNTNIYYIYVILILMKVYSEFYTMLLATTTGGRQHQIWFQFKQFGYLEETCKS